MCSCLTHYFFFLYLPFICVQQEAKNCQGYLLLVTLICSEHTHTALCRDMETWNFRTVRKGFISCLSSRPCALTSLDADGKEAF